MAQCQTTAPICPSKKTKRPLTEREGTPKCKDHSTGDEKKDVNVSESLLKREADEKELKGTRVGNIFYLVLFPWRLV